MEDLRPRFQIVGVIERERRGEKALGHVIGS